jgi:hypothetical protein
MIHSLISYISGTSLEKNILEISGGNIMDLDNTPFDKAPQLDNPNTEGN